MAEFNGFFCSGQGEITRGLIVHQSIYGSGRKEAFDLGSDSWLRINDTGGFSSGVYFGSSTIRTDGRLEVGGSGSTFYADDDGAVVIGSTATAFNVTPDATFSGLINSGTYNTYIDLNSSDSLWTHVGDIIIQADSDNTNNETVQLKSGANANFKITGASALYSGVAEFSGHLKVHNNKTIGGTTIDNGGIIVTNGGTAKLALDSNEIMASAGLYIRGTGSLWLGVGGTTIGTYTSSGLAVAGAFSASGAISASGGLIVDGHTDPGATNYGGFRSAGTNIVLEGNSDGVSGIFFKSNKTTGDINHPTDYGFIQYHAYGLDGSSGEANRLVIGVANDSTDYLVLQSPYKNGVKITYQDASSGTAMSTYTVWHAGNGGSGSGLDADKVDGIQGSSLLRSDADDELNAKIDVPTAKRSCGMYGVYDSTKIGHVWSMGTSYTISDSGADFGDIYGMAYKHTNNTTGGTMAGGHQIVFCNAGTPGTSIGLNGNVWTKGGFDSDGTNNFDGQTNQSGIFIQDSNYMRMNDNIEFYLGSGNDIAHVFNGTDYYISMANGADFRLRGGDNGQNPMITCIDDAGVHLYYNGSTRFETTNNGLSVNNGFIDMNGNGITDLGAPNSGDDAVRWDYVEDFYKYSSDINGGSQVTLSQLADARYIDVYVTFNNINCGVSRIYLDDTGDDVGDNYWGGVTVAAADNQSNFFYSIFYVDKSLNRFRHEDIGYVTRSTKYARNANSAYQVTSIRFYK